LTALVAGYEVQCRCARDFIRRLGARAFRASRSTGFSAAPRRPRSCSASTRAASATAIALAASFAGSLIEGQRTGTREADFAEAQAARSGCGGESRHAGIQGRPDGLEGEGGFYNAFTR